MVKQIFLLILIFLSATFVVAQGHTLELELCRVEKHSFDSLIFNGRNIFDAPCVIRGEQTGENKWTFIIPDDVINNVGTLNLMMYEFKDSGKRIIHDFTFHAVNGNDTIRYSGIVPERKLDKITATFFETSIMKNHPVNDGKERYRADLHFHHFYTNPLPADCETMIYAKHPFFAWFRSDTTDYSQVLDEHIDIIKEHPDSKYLIYSLCNRLSYIKTNEDLNRLFEAFSSQNQQSRWGKEIRKYMASSRDDVLLLSCENDKPQTIIQDTSIYTLVVFSATWCGYCHKMIPDLKKIYTDLKDRLEIVYVTIDKPHDIDKWKTLIEKEAIPWRCLYSETPSDIIRHYNSNAIPRSILFYPASVKEEVIDVRNKEDNDKLYFLCNSLGNE